MLLVKIALAGDEETGKKELLPEGTLAEATIDGTPIRFRIWEASGLPKSQTLRKIGYSGCSGAIVVFDVTKPETFSNLDSWITEFWKYNGKGRMPVVIAGNRVDTRTAEIIADEKAHEFAERLTRQCRENKSGAKVSYFPTDGTNLSEMLEALGRNIVQMLELQKKGVREGVEEEIPEATLPAAEPRAAPEVVETQLAGTEIGVTKHPVIEVKGIGAKTLDQLTKINIVTAEELIARDPHEIAELLGRKSDTQIRKWQENARILLA